jgi:DNA-binding NtrC family response regulator
MADLLENLFRPARREEARKRRLAVLATCALPQPLPISALCAALGEELAAGFELAEEDGFCRLLPGGQVEPMPKAVLDLAITLLDIRTITRTLTRLAPLAASEDEQLLLLLAGDPLGEGRRRLEAGAPGRVAAMAPGLRQALGLPVETGAPEPFEPAPWGSAGRRVSALLCVAAHGLIRRGHWEEGRRLMAWALGPEGLAGRVSPEHGFLAPTHVQFLLDAGRREEGVAFARLARERLLGPENTFSRLMLMVLEGRVAIDRGEHRLARGLYGDVQLQARAAGLEDLVGLAKVAFATLARREDQNTAALQLCLGALEIFLGDEPFEAVALHNLGLAYLKEGRALEAQAALTRSLEGMDIPFQQLTAYPQAIACDCFLGDTAEAERKLAVLTSLAPDTPQARLSLGLCRAHLHSARAEWEATLRELEAPHISDVKAQNHLYAVPAGWLRMEALLALGRAEEASRVFADLSRDLYLSNLSTQPAGLNLLDARVAFANGDLERARRVLRRTRSSPEAARAQDFELRARMLAFQLAAAEGREGPREEARRAATEAWEALTQSLPHEVRRRFRRAYDRPRLLALLGVPTDEEGTGLSYLRGTSPAFHSMVAQLRRVAASDASVLLLGETGVGKELAARAIHDFSRRASGPFVAVNCAAIGDELLLSELFGHEKGAFTGAVQRHLGRFEQAHGGTLFLDEIADISPRGQAALLRALQERSFERVGGTEMVRVDVRIVAASNRDLAEAVRAEDFRQDLFFRLAGIQVKVPPLRERGEDARVLAAWLLEQAAQERGAQPRRLSTEAERLMREYAWPGNIRELRNVVLAADILSESPIIAVDVLVPLLQRIPPRAGPLPREGEAAMLDAWLLFRQHGGTLRRFLSDIQRTCMERCLVENDGNIAATAAELGFSRSRLTQIVLSDPDLRRLAGRDEL